MNITVYFPLACHTCERGYDDHRVVRRDGRVVVVCGRTK